MNLEMNLEQLQHVFEAFSTLSDAEECLTEFNTAARGHIRHAKEHLNVLMLAAGSESTDEAIQASLGGCSLKRREN